MNYGQIEAFLSIANTRSISRAAETLFVSQSTISQRLFTLEEELNVQLIVRHKGHRSIELTEAGERFIPIAHHWNALWNETLSLHKTVEGQVLDVGGVDSVSTYFLCPFYKLLKDNEPTLQLRIHICSNSPQIYTLLENREIDIGFVTVPSWNRNIILEPILSNEFRIVRYSRSGHDVTGPVDPATLDPKFELYQPWGPEYQQWHDYWWPTPQHPYSTFDATAMLRDFLDDERKWAIVPECIASNLETFGGFHSYTILTPPPRHVGYKAVHRYPKSMCKAHINIFEKYLRRYLAKHRLAYKQDR